MIFTGDRRPARCMRYGCSRPGDPDPFTVISGDYSHQLAISGEPTPGISFRLTCVFDRVAASARVPSASCCSPWYLSPMTDAAVERARERVLYDLQLGMGVFLREAPDLAAGRDRRIVVEIHLADEIDFLAPKTAGNHHS